MDCSFSSWFFFVGSPSLLTLCTAEVVAGAVVAVAAVCTSGRTVAVKVCWLAETKRHQF